MTKRFTIVFIALILSVCSACQSNRKVQSPVETDTGVLQNKIDSLTLRTQELEQQNASQEERIKNLEDELENVITFLGNEMGY